MMMELLAGIWYRRKWLGAKVLSTVVPERWLWTRHWKRRDQQDERLFWKSLKTWNERAGRSLEVKDEQKLKEQVDALYEAGLEGGFIPWHSASPIETYKLYKGIWDYEK